MWRSAAANLYQLGVVPLLEQLEAVSAAQGAGFRPGVVQYQTTFNALRQGSVLSTAQNLEVVSETVALMTAGDALVDGMRAALEDQGVAPLELAIPGPPAQPDEKPAWARLAWPGAIVGGVVVVIGLAAWASSSAARKYEEGRESVASQRVGKAPNARR